MGSMNYFGQVVQEILQNKYLKTNFENSEIGDFVPTFWNFIRGKFFQKNALFFLTLNEHISITIKTAELNEAILKSSHWGLSFDGIVRF